MRSSRRARETVGETAPLAGRDNAKLRRERGSGQLEAHLIVPLPGRPVRNRVCFFGARNLDHSFRDERARNTRAEKILALVNRAGLEHRKNKIAGEFFLEIGDVTFGRPNLAQYISERLEMTPNGFEAKEGQNNKSKLVYEKSRDPIQ
jgi:hypothetical protein